MMSTSTKNIQKLAKQARRFLEIGDVHQAEIICDKAVAQVTTDPDMLLQIGKVHYFRKRYDEAGNIFRQVHKLRPKDSEVRIMLWATYRDGDDFEAMLNLARQFQNQPLNANEVLFAYRSFLAACDWRSAEKMQERIFTLVKQREIRHDLIPALLIELCGIDGLSPELVFDIHRQWGNEEVKEKQLYSHANMPAIPITRRLKVAYISSDFKLHPVGFYMNQIIRSHDRQRFEIYCYAHLGRDDMLTQHVRENADHFIDITTLRDEAVASRIHADGIHILIDLGGHTTDTRLPVLAYRPAPVQMTYLGYPNTSGLPTVDYRITDHNAECEEGTRYVEKLLYMPQSFLCYGVDPSGLRKDSSPAEKKNHITFVSFNNIRKMTPQVIQTWSQILNRVSGSKLALKARNLNNIVVRDNMMREFASHGIQGERIEFRPYTKTYEEHMVQYNDTDIALDTFPYNGTTTTCDALVMGVPVITLVGKSHVQRVSCSILKNIGFEETITHSMDEYVDKAVALASNRQGLTVLRNTLPTLFRHSILYQPEKFTRQLEGLYLQAWEEKYGTFPIIAKPEEKEARLRRLHIGGHAPHPDWEIMDALPGDHVDHIGNAKNLSQFPDCTFAALYASHVLEHFSYQNEILAVLQEWKRVLIPGGKLYLSVPDLDTLAQLFTQREVLSPDDRYMVMRIMFGGQTTDYDFHKVGLYCECLTAFLNEANFENIRKVDGFGIFQDTSTMIFANVPISLNIIAEKPLEPSLAVLPSNKEPE